MQRMQDVYFKARLVLVIDAFLETTRIPETIEEFLALVLSSPWFSRLWTFSEGSLARFVWIVFENFSIQGLDNFLREHMAPDFKDAKPTQDLSPSWVEVQQTVGRLRALRPLRPQIFNHGDENLRPDFLDNLISSIHHRQTSRKQDEAICLAVALGLQAPLTQASPDESMQELYSQMSHVPGTLIIFSGERLKMPGYRWAPRTLIGRREVFRNSHGHDHTVRHAQLGIRVPDGYVVFLLKPITQISVQPEADESEFKWGESLIKLIFFRVGSETFYIRTSEDPNNMSQAAKQMRIPMHPEMEYSMAIVIRAHHSSGWLPGALLDVHTAGKGEAVLLSDAELHLSMDSIDLNQNEVDDDHGEERLVLQHEAKDGTWIQYDRESERQIEQHYLTDYHDHARVYLLAGAEKEKLYRDFDLDDGFAGIEPWDRDRLVCEARPMDLEKEEVWIA